MTSDRFLAVQSEIQDAPSPLWERWTIDEIDEGAARVLISRAGNTRQIRGLADHVMTERATASERPTRRLADVLRAEAMRIELDPAAQQWSEESISFGTVPPLQAFLRSRGGKPGLPTNRPLREGDVFWVLVAVWPGATEPPGDLTATELEAHMAALQAAGVDVWDVTAAARQAAKRSYHEVMRRTNEIGVRLSR